MSIWFYMIFGLALMAIPIYIVVSVVRSMLQKGKEGICTNCGFRARGKMHTRGSFAIEVVLWLAFIIPGLIYSLWRLSTRKEVCASCGQATVIPLASPRGQQLAQEYVGARAKAG